MPISANTYKVNWNKLVSWLLPTSLFKPKMFVWLKSLVIPINQLHTDLINYRYQKLYDLSISGQVCKLEKLLNDKFDEVHKRIYIVDGERSKKRYIYQQLEVIKQNVYKTIENKPLFIYKDAEIQINTIHFVVMIPNSLRYDIDVFVSILNIFKMPSKRYTIQTF